MFYCDFTEGQITMQTDSKSVSTTTTLLSDKWAVDGLNTNLPPQQIQT